MNKFIFVFSVLIVLGAGCSNKETAGKKTSIAFEKREGISIITGAIAESGPTVSKVEAKTGRLFTTELPSTFFDKRGKYTTALSGELVNVQISISGSPETDRLLFGKQFGLERFEDGAVGNWKVTSAFQTASNRWLIRATQKDFQTEGMYHVIECLGVEKSNYVFWNGCRTIIEKAKISQSKI